MQHRILRVAALSLLGSAARPALGQGVDLQITGPAFGAPVAVRVDANPGTAGHQVARRVPNANFTVRVMADNVPPATPLRAVHFWVFYDPLVVKPVGPPPFYPGFVAGTAFPSFSACDLPGCGGGPGVVQVIVTGKCVSITGNVLLADLAWEVLDPEGQTEIAVGSPAVAPETVFFTRLPGPMGDCCTFDCPTIGAAFLHASAIVVIDSTATLSCLNVNTTSDMAALNPSGRNPDCNPVLGIGEISLRSAIQIANLVTGGNHPTVRIDSSAPTIMPGSPLPVLSDASGGTYLDATTQDGGVTLQGSGAAAAVLPAGFTLATGSNTIDGWAIGNWAGSGVCITGAGATLNKIKHCRIGDILPNGDGVAVIGGASFNDVGLPSAGDGNVISGNTGSGVLISGAGTTGNEVRSNLIGTNAAGDAALPNLGNGVHITAGATGNTIGGMSSGDRNTISGNGENGVRISAVASGNFVEGNNIGTDASATSAVANVQSGVRIDAAAAGNVIGGVLPAAANVIAGNTLHGVHINGAATDGNEVRRNRIGSNFVVSGIPNEGHGVLIDGAAKSNVIADNTIEANGSGSLVVPNGDGVNISGAGTDLNEVLSNFIGAVGLANMSQGVRLEAAANDNQISLNNIGNNTKNGVLITDTGTYYNTITGNLIIGNGQSGVEITGPFPGAFTPEANIIGGSIPLAGNLISGNLLDGVRITNGGIPAVTLLGNRVQGNTIDHNRFDGVAMLIAIDQRVEDNVIHDNGRSGVTVIEGPGNSIRRNQIYSNGPIAPGLGIDLMPGGATGVNPNDATDVDIGPNDLMNYPVLTSAGATITGSLASGGASDMFTLDFFSNAGCDPSGHGEGATYIGSADVAGGGVVFDVPLAVAAGSFITATATDSGGSTSEFSACVEAGAGCPWDCDGTNDGIVSVTDLLAMLAQWDTTNPPCDGGGQCDYNDDGCVDVVDLLKLLAHYDPAGAGCP